MTTKNTCYTYFRIVGDFNPDEVSALLNITPEETWKMCTGDGVVCYPKIQIPWGNHSPWGKPKN